MTILFDDQPAGAGDRDHNFATIYNPAPGANNTVQAVSTYLQSDQAGKTLIGGEFTSVNSVDVTRIARLTRGGAVDTSFNAGSGADGSIINGKADGKEFAACIVLVDAAVKHFGEVADTPAEKEMTAQMEKASREFAANYAQEVLPRAQKQTASQDDQITVLRHAVVHHAFSDQALHQRHVQRARQPLLASPQPANAFDRHAQENRQPVDPLIDRRPGLECQRPRVYHRHQPSRLCRPQPVWPDLPRPGQHRQNPALHPPGPPGHPRAVHRLSHRALRRQFPALDGPRPGARPARHRRPGRIRPGHCPGAARPVCPREHGRHRGQDRSRQSRWWVA